MYQIAYQFLYSPRVNCTLRNFNKFIRQLIPSIPKIPPSGKIHIDLENKRVIITTNQTNYLTYLVFWEGYLNFEYTSIFIDLIKKINTFYDIGANIGYYSLLAAAINPDIYVFSFEPASGPLFFLKKNVEANKFTNISIEPMALSHQPDGLIEFYEIRNKKYSYLEHNLAGESNAGSNTAGRNFTRIEVPTTTLDNFFLTNHQKGVDLIKIDTEGTEHLILEHASKVLSEMRPIIICETLFNTIEMELETIMKKFGYRFFNHTATGLQEVPTLKRNIDNGVRNCFFVPSQKLHLISNYLVG